MADPDGLPLLTAALGSPGAESSINTAPSARICSGSLSAEKCNVGSVSDEIITAACDCGASGSTLHRPLSYASIVKKYKEGTALYKMILPVIVFSHISVLLLDLSPS